MDLLEQEGGLRAASLSNNNNAPPPPGTALAQGLRRIQSSPAIAAPKGAAAASP
jgi:hypothetical protein